MSNIGNSFKPKASGTAARLGPNSVACKCQICNCGSHKCPPDRHIHELTPYEMDALRTGYQRDYPAHPLGARAPRGGPKSEGLGWGQGKFEGQTTCQADFVPHAAGARGVPARPPQGDSGLINGGNSQRSFGSETQQQYGPKGSGVRESYAPQGMQHTTGARFDGSTTTGSDYHAHRGAKPSTPFKEASTRNAAPEDRDFQTEAALKFVTHADAQRRANFAPQARSNANVPFDGMSTTKADYPGWKGAAPARSAAPKQNSSAGAQDDRDFRTQNTMAFDPKGYAQRESFKPRSDQLRQQGPFEGMSTNKADFSGARGMPAQSARPSVGLTDTIGVPLGARDDRAWVTEHHGQFIPSGGVKRESYAPQGMQHTTGARFDGSTTSGSDYHAHRGAKPSTPFKEASTRNAAPEDRDFGTETQLQFHPHAGGAGVRKSFAPTNARAGQHVPFEGISTTKADYPGWKPQGCPANELPNNGTRGADGHTLYTNASGHWEPHNQ